jgi:hypothetical protein
MGRELVFLFSADTLKQAETVERLLNEAGIEVILHDDDEATWIQDTSEIVPPKLFVNADDELRARALLETFERHGFEHPIAEPAASEPERQRVVGFFSKPPCVSCGAPRPGTCTYCGATVTHFEHVEDDMAPEKPGGEVAQLICPVCHEPTIPQWAGACEDCKQPFTDA